MKQSHPTHKRKGENNQTYVLSNHRKSSKSALLLQRKQIIMEDLFQKPRLREQNGKITLDLGQEIFGR